MDTIHQDLTIIGMTWQKCSIEQITTNSDERH